MVTSRGTGQVLAVPPALFISTEPLSDWTNIRNIQLFDIWAPLWPSTTWASRAHQAGGWGLGLSLAAAPGTAKPQHFQHQHASPSRWCEERVGELGREQTNLYKLQSYYIYSAQAEPEPWGTQDGNNLPSRFAWSYAAFGRSDTVNGWGGAQAWLHLCDRYPHPAAPGGAWPLLLEGRDSWRREGGTGYSWSSQSLCSLGRNTGMCLCHHRQLQPIVCKYTVISLSFPIPQHTWEGKGQGMRVRHTENAPPGQEKEDILPPLGLFSQAWRCQGGTGTWVGAGARKNVRSGWPRGGSCRLCPARLCPLLLGQSNAALAGRGLIQD